MVKCGFNGYAGVVGEKEEKVDYRAKIMNTS